MYYFVDKETFEVMGTSSEEPQGLPQGWFSVYSDLLGEVRYNPDNQEIELKVPKEVVPISPFVSLPEPKRFLGTSLYDQVYESSLEDLAILRDFTVALAAEAMGNLELLSGAMGNLELLLKDY